MERVVVAAAADEPLPYTRPVSWVAVKGLVPLPKMKPLAEKVAAPVPPLTIERVEVWVRGLVPLPKRRSFAVKVAAPVPPLTILRVEVEVTAPVPPETKSSPEDRPVVMREPLILSCPSKVELALTKMPAVLEVGVRALVNSVSQAPGDPDPPPQPVQLSTMIAPFTVRVPPTVTAPLNLLVPRTPKVVEAFVAPIMTSFSLALTTKVLVSKTPLSEKVEVAWVMESS
jgi:hypothetical protein